MTNQSEKKEKQMNEQDKTAIIGAIELEIDGYLDGTPDANEASKLANRISGIIHNGRACGLTTSFSNNQTTKQNI